MSGILTTLLGVSQTSHAESFVPAGPGPHPLMVMLHGDAQPAKVLLAAWEKKARSRGVALLSLTCPTALGCDKTSYWQWDGPASWALGELDTFVAANPIDPQHIYLLGWSGGASWLGRRMLDWEGRFAALVVHGGGLPPEPAGCPTRCAIPTYFLVGNANPYHHLAVALKDQLTTCKQDVTWDVLPRAGHGDEWMALGPRQDVILDFLLKRSLTCIPVAADAGSDAADFLGDVSDVGVGDTLGDRPGGSVPTSSASYVPIHTPPKLHGSLRELHRSACACSTPGLTSSSGFGSEWLATLVALTCGWKKRERARSRSRDANTHTPASSLDQFDEPATTSTPLG